VKSSTAVCFKRRRGTPENQSVSDDVIADRCKCYANLIADLTMREDIQYMAKYGTPSANVKERIMAAYSKCAPQQLAITVRETAAPMLQLACEAQRAGFLKYSAYSLYPRRTNGAIATHPARGIQWPGGPTCND
jgi:hypothetical protein